MTDYQTSEQAMDLMVGRTLKCLGPSSSSRTGRPLGFAFLDLVTGEPVLVAVMSGAVEAYIVPTPEGTMNDGDRDAAMTTFRTEAIDALKSAMS